ncbi:MAG: hypothetical protein WCG92_06230 [Hyphomicrobiales bacterium]|nr:hypothetical protein [Alphaproteobacteria bacterium]
MLAVLGIYAASLISQALLTAPVTARMSVAPFLLAQIVLTWIWIVLHRRRLRDAGRPTGIVIGIAMIYALEVILMALLIAVLTSATRDDANSGAAIFHLYAVIYLLASITGESNLAGVQLWLTGFVVVMLLPILIAAVFSLWTATRPSVAADP